MESRGGESRHDRRVEGSDERRRRREAGWSFERLSPSQRRRGQICGGGGWLPLPAPDELVKWRQEEVPPVSGPDADAAWGR